MARSVKSMSMYGDSEVLLESSTKLKQSICRLLILTLLYTDTGQGTSQSIKQWDGRTGEDTKASNTKILRLRSHIS